MADNIDYAGIGRKLYTALKDCRTITPLTEDHSELSIDDAYRISLEFLRLREDQGGEHVVGKKIGVTSKAVQDMLGVYQPDFGFLTNKMHVNDGQVNTSELIAPRAEAEIAFRLKHRLIGPGITAQDVIDATEYVQPCFEIVDSRIQDWKIRIADTIADNASCGVFVLGAQKIDPQSIDMSKLEVIVSKNGSEISRGLGEAVQGAPENAVAWLANTLGEYDIPFEAGEIILSGSLVPLEPVSAGDVMHMSIAKFGSCSVNFV